MTNVSLSFERIFTAYYWYITCFTQSNHTVVSAVYVILCFMLFGIVCHCVLKQSIDLHSVEISRWKNREKELLHKVFETAFCLRKCDSP